VIEEAAQRAASSSFGGPWRRRPRGRWPVTPCRRSRIH